MSVRLLTFGALKVVLDDEELSALPGQPVRVGVLLYLAHEEEVNRDQVMGVFWPDREPSRARHSLSQTLYELRRELGEDWLEASGQWIRVTDELWLDATAFTAMVEEGRYDEALELYGEPHFGGAPLDTTAQFEHWAERKSASLGRLHRKARSEHVGSLVDGGRIEEALSHAREWIEIDRLDDEAHHRLIELFARTGRRSEALRHYEQYEELLSRELEVEPLEETRNLVEKIRTGNDEFASASLTSGEVREAPASEWEPSPEPGTARPTTKVSENAVAVLPFTSMSPDRSDEYFSDGITEELINALSRLEGLRVAAATSSFAIKGKSVDVREIGERLAVRWVVEGSVRKYGDDLRISARLVSTADGYELWSETFDRHLEDVFAIQDEIAWAITDSLALHLGRRRRSLVTRHTSVPEAYDLYLMGRYFYGTRTPEGLERAIEYFREAIERDAGYALAYSGLADALIGQAHFQYRPPLEVLPEAEAATEKALGIDPTLAEAQSSRAHIEDSFHWRWREAEKGYRKAIELDPAYAHARIIYADLLTALGRHDESRTQAEQAEDLEPLSVPIKFQIGTQLYRARRFGEATEVLHRTLEMDPTYFPARAFQGLTLVAMDRPDEAISVMEEAVERFGPHPALHVIRGYALARVGREDEARKVLDALQRLERERYVPSLLRTVILGALGDEDEAFRALDQALEERYAQLTFLAVDPVYDPLADDPRFQRVLDELELPRRS